MRISIRPSVVLLLVGAMALPALSSETGTTSSQPITEWLVSGPQERALPALLEEDAEADLLLDAPGFHPGRLRPESGAGGPAGPWALLSKPEGGFDLASPEDAAAELVLATHLVATRFVEAKLAFTGDVGVRAYLNGELLQGEAPWSLALPRGKHQLLVHLVAIPGVAASRSLLSLETADPEDALSWQTDEARGLALPDILDSPSVSDLALSADGTLLALRKRAPSVPAEGREEWIEFIDTATGALVRRSHAPLSGFAWSPRGRQYSFVTREADEGTLWLADFDSGSALKLLEKVAHLGTYRWAPDGTAIVYSITTKAEEPDEKKSAGHERIRSLPDRWAGHRDRSHLYRLDLGDMTRQRLTAGDLTTDLQDISPEGTHLLFTRARDDREEWPFLETELWELDLETLEARKVATPFWNARAVYGPGARRALVLAGPSAFGDVGVALEEEEVIPNEYEGQAYILDLASGEADPIAKDFDPAITGGTWRTHDGAIYLQAEDGEYLRLYRYDREDRSFTAISGEVEVVRGAAYARDADIVAYRGSSAGDPGGVFVVPDPTRNEGRLVDPVMAEAMESVDIGVVLPFEFESSGGTTIAGRVHLPRDYDRDARKKYPAIVYYYGGTSPVSRDFGGRWPKNWWAAQGYVVYVLQPSGATGFGQEFATRHVNDWGKTSVGEIIEGTQAFLEAFPGVDPDRVGCMGASYGGFMTQLLITHTDMFSAAVSHAGISSISSYWGEGWWGYIYSAIATAKSYPWNAPDIYVGQSALFRADKINTPLLLLHGSVDTNVPRGESDQMFTALKLLGREVEYVRIAGEDHLIMSYDKRKRWMETIIAWFDRELKDQPEWWQHLYPDSKEK